MLVREPWVMRMLGAVGGGVGVCTGALGVGRAVGRGDGPGVAGGAVGAGVVAVGRGVTGAAELDDVAVGALEGSAGADGLAVHGAEGEAPGALLVGRTEGPGVGDGASGPARLAMARPPRASATSQTAGLLAAWWST